MGDDLRRSAALELLQRNGADGCAAFAANPPSELDYALIRNVDAVVVVADPPNRPPDLEMVAPRETTRHSESLDGCAAAMTVTNAGPVHRCVHVLADRQSEGLASHPPTRLGTRR